MAALGVEVGQVVGNGSARFGHALVRLQVHLLVLETPPEPLNVDIADPGLSFPSIEILTPNFF